MASYHNTTFKGTPIFNTSAGSHSSESTHIDGPSTAQTDNEKIRRMESSAWGSFTGSFFQASDLKTPDETEETTNKEGMEILI